MDLMETVNTAGGIMSVRELRYRTGASRHAVDRAVGKGALLRPTRGWVATHGADPVLVAAAQTGVVIACVTRAARLGLWDVGAPQIHVAARPCRELRRPTQAHVHWAKPRVPRHPDSLEDGVVNTLALVSECQPFESALAVWESALNQNMVTLPELETIAFGPAGRELRRAAQPYSDSGVESILVPRLRWLNLPMRRQIWVLGHRVDLLIGDRLIVQVDGGHHVDEQRTSDNRHDARLLLAGYRVIRVGYRQLVHDWPSVQSLITGAIARGLQTAKRA